MYPALVVLWLSAPPALTPPPEVASWAAQRGFRAVPMPVTPEPPYAEAAAQEIESLLEEARSLASGAAPFARLDQLLLEHPELPQAGWWLAERYALERYALERQLAGAEAARQAELEQHRAALEGPRADTAAGAETGPESAAASVALAPRGLRARDLLLLDGERVGAGSPVAVGRHHAQVLRAGRRVWAGWIQLDSAELQLPEAAAPCSELDLLGTEYASDAARPAPGVTCPTWAVAHERSGGVELALCHADRCEPWQQRSSALRAASAEAPRAAEAAEPLPAWLTWGALGLGAVASTALVLWQAGAFDRPAPAPEFVFTGPSAAAVRF